MDYVEHIISFEQKNNINVSFVELFPLISKYVQKHLDKRTANFLGSIPFSTKGKELFGKEAAPKISFKSLFVYRHLDYISIARCNSFVKPIVKVIKFIFSPTTYGYISKDRQLAYIKIFSFKINIANLIWK